MRRRGAILWLCAAALALLLLTGTLPAGGSRYSCTVEKELFSLGLESFSGERAETFFLREGDSVDVSIVRVSGRLSVSVGQEGRPPVYEGADPQPGSFRVTIPEDGNYLLSVSGKRAEGSVTFRIRRAAE